MKKQATWIEGEEIEVFGQVRAFVNKVEVYAQGIEDRYYYDLQGRRKEGRVPYKLVKQGVKQKIIYGIYYLEKEVN